MFISVYILCYSVTVSNSVMLVPCLSQGRCLVYLSHSTSCRLRSRLESYLQTILEIVFRTGASLPYILNEP